MNEDSAEPGEAAEEGDRAVNVNQQLALGKLRAATPGHEVEYCGRSSAHSYKMKCSCGWSWATNTRNALARKSQMYGAESQHLKEQQK